jgi:hypothetical protein
MKGVEGVERDEEESPGGICGDLKRQNGSYCRRIVAARLPPMRGKRTSLSLFVSIVRKTWSGLSV